MNNRTQMQKSTYTLALLCAIGALTATSVLAQAVKPLTTDQVAFVKIAKQNVVRNFRDPVNVQYRNVYISKTGENAILCGEVNGKNAYGGFVGFRSFVAFLDKDTTVVGGELFPPDLAEATKNAVCKIKVIDVE